MNFSDSKNYIIDCLNNTNLNHVDSQVSKLAKRIIDALKNNNKILVCGNGGSAAESEHLIAELICKFKKVRKAVPALSLSPNNSTLTAIGNDFSFEQIFSRSLEALGSDGDILISLSTSGNSQNVINAVNLARELNIYSFSLLGQGGGEISNISSESFIVESERVSTIQEIHLIFLHSLCSQIDKLIDEQ
tara:strand:- start:284 stop:853 length:570 start_codon:yes stop_codon:yes gene_type:complete